MPHKILIANRGAIARRIVRACASAGMSSAVVYGDADAGAPYLGEAGEAVYLPGSSVRDTYLNTPLLVRNALDIGADAVHPGYGFLSENADFARAVRDAGLTFIGPDADVIEAVADKVRARTRAERAGVPVFPGSGLLQNLDHLRAEAEALGYPLLVKPSAGGGGIGMRVVHDACQLEAAYAQSVALAEGQFGDASVYLERWMPASRHVELQLLGDRAGRVMHLYERDCSLQRRHQKVVEEAPAPGVTRGEIESLAAHSIRFAESIGYNNAGTIEYLRDVDPAVPSARRYGFLEVNARIQVEHAVTEAVTGVDLVASQLKLAFGGALPACAGLSGHAVEARVYAEDVTTGLPSAGRLVRFRPPAMRHVRVETGYQEGMLVTSTFDPLLAKVIGWGHTRTQAIGRCWLGLKAFDIVGVRTNASLIRFMLHHEQFLSGAVHTELYDTLREEALADGVLF